MQGNLIVDRSTQSHPIWFVTSQTADDALAHLSHTARAWAQRNGFGSESTRIDAGHHLLLPNEAGDLEGVLFGIEASTATYWDPFLPGKLATLLPDGVYRFANAPHDARLAALAWLTSSYRLSRYRPSKAKPARLIVPQGVDAADIQRLAEAITFGRDLINTPANDMGPNDLEQAMQKLAKKHNARFSAIVGDDLLAQNFPMIHAVGRASAHAPRLLDLTWGRDSDPKISLVGEGVTFDTGGLNIKPDSAMLLMKKDMGGAASALAAASIIMDAKLPVRLRVTVPAVENAISGTAFRPGDVLSSRKGLTVEIGNTDAEGRLILADALALADEEAPNLIISMATLTGAARVALGPDLPALFTDDDGFAESLQKYGLAESDPLWRMPFWNPYDEMLKSKIADVNHISGGPFAGAVTAALFLRRFVEKAKTYAHLDMFCWNPATKPGRPEGGEVMGARALVAYLQKAVKQSSQS